MSTWMGQARARCDEAAAHRGVRGRAGPAHRRAAAAHAARRGCRSSILVSLVLLGGVVGLLLFNTSMQQASFTATALEDQAERAARRGAGAADGARPAPRPAAGRRPGPAARHGAAGSTPRSSGSPTARCSARPCRPPRSTPSGSRRCPTRKPAGFDPPARYVRVAERGDRRRALGRRGRRRRYKEQPGSQDQATQDQATTR